MCVIYNFRRTYILFCRENFDYPELEEHPHLCNHLGKARNMKLSYL